MPELLLFALLLGLSLLWWDSAQARERAVDAARAACRRNAVQFLDQSVSLRRLRPKRDHDGRLRLARLYTFEFSPDGLRRCPGFVVSLGTRISELHLDPDTDAGSIEQPGSGGS